MVIYKLFIEGIEDVCYIGSTSNLQKRLKTHASLLKNNNHFNFLLQKAYNESSSKKIKIEHIATTTQESRYIDEYNQIIKEKNVYNVYINNSAARFGNVISNHPKKKEIVDKIKKTLNDKFALMSKDEKRAMFGKFNEENPNWRGGTSKSYCGCGKTKALNAKTCSKCRDRSGNKNPFFGKKHNEETIKKIALANKGRKPLNSRKVMINGIEYESATAAAKELNCVTATILNRINSKKEGYYFIL